MLPGVYSNATGFSINGSVNLDAQNNPNAVFVLQTPGNLSSGTSSHVTLINGTQPCNVFWQVAGSIALGNSSDFKGTVLGKGNFTSAVGTVVTGKVFISQGSVALNASQITRPNCKVYPMAETERVGKGEGTNQSQYGNANFNFDIKGSDNGTGTYTNVGGKLTWNVANGWKFTGTPTAFVYANGSGTILGTGTLSYFSNPKKEKDARWVTATKGTVSFTAKFTRNLNVNATYGKVNAFAIGFSGNLIPGVIQLPILGALSTTKVGNDN